MLNFDDKNTWFEQELKSSVSEHGIHFDAVEASLARRIRECGAHGILGLLCKEEIYDEGKMERVEQELFSQITQYGEYDEPVNECIKADDDLTEKQWERIASRIEDRLLPVMGLPLWEQQIRASQEEPTVGYWEAFELCLFDRINRLEQKTTEKWEQYEIKDEPVVASSLERAEVLLQDHIESVASRPLWEHVIAADEIVPLYKWEAIEEALFDSIEKEQSVPLKHQPFWYFIEHFASFLKGAAVAGTVMGVVASAFFGVRYYKSGEGYGNSLVYQVEGSGAEHTDMTETVGSHFSMVDGGKVTLVNKHGYVALTNSAAVTIEKLSRREARYHVDFAARNREKHGDIAFFVKKQSSRNRFSVKTQDYRIEVQGTYFTVESAPNGAVTTRVLEGRVRVTDSPLGDTLLSAGQWIAYDSLLGTYAVYSGGQTVAREEVESVPELSEILQSPITTILSSEPDAKVYLNGKFLGASPLRIRLAEGEYRASIRKPGYATIDTTLLVSALHHEFSFTIVSEDPVKLAKGSKKRAVQPPHAASVTTIVKNADTTTIRQQENNTGLSDLYNEAQGAERKGNWRTAIEYYKKVFDDPSTTPLRREDVLFSIGKLQAEHISDIEVAKRSFLTYVALFPDGSFAGESWLRLAELEFQKNQERAVHYYQKFFNQFPRHPRSAELKDRVGVIYLQQKQFEKAISMFDQALSVSGVSESLSKSIAKHLHRALVEIGNQQRAEAVSARYLLSER